jgi:tetratricopeptide (TPR) repeat protein
MSTAPETFIHPRRMIVVWVLLLAAGMVLLAAGGLLLHRKAAALRESSPWTYLKEAERLKNANRPLEAIAALQRAADLDPTSPVPHEEIGRIYFTRQSDWTKALESYRRALELGSESADVRGKAIWSLIHLSRYREAAELGQLCIDQGFDAPDFNRFIAEAYRRAKMDKESIPHFEAAVAAFPGDMMLLERLMEAYAAVGNLEKRDEIKKRIERNEG